MYSFVVKYKVQIITGLRALFQSAYFSLVRSTTERKRKKTEKKTRQREHRKEKRQDSENKEDSKKKGTTERT